MLAPSTASLTTFCIPLSAESQAWCAHHVVAPLEDPSYCCADVRPAAVRMSSPVDIQVLLTTQGDLAASQAVANEQEAHHQELADEFLLVSGSGNTSSTGSERVSLYAPLCAPWRWRSHRPSCVSGQMPCPGELCSQQCFPCIIYAHLLITNQGLLVSPLQPGCRVLTSFHASV